MSEMCLIDFLFPLHSLSLSLSFLVSFHLYRWFFLELVIRRGSKCMFANMIREDERHDLSWEDILMKYIPHGFMMKIMKRAKISEEKGMEERRNSI